MADMDRQHKREEQSLQHEHRAAGAGQEERNGHERGTDSAVDAVKKSGTGMTGAASA